MNPLQGFGILCDTGGSPLGLENTEISKFQAIPPAEFFDNLIQERLNYFLDRNAFLSGLVGDAVY